MDKSILKGVIDTHIHTAPDAFRRRKFNDLELADEAERCGARAIVIKSHSLETAARSAAGGFPAPESAGVWRFGIKYLVWGIESFCG